MGIFAAVPLPARVPATSRSLRANPFVHLLFRGVGRAKNNSKNHTKTEAKKRNRNSKNARKRESEKQPPKK